MYVCVCWVNEFIKITIFAGGKAGNDVSTFDCLTSDLADVAFVNLKAIEKKTFNFNGNTSGNKKYRILCLNEEDAEKQQCLLTWTTLSSVCFFFFNIRFKKFSL